MGNVSRCLAPATVFDSASTYEARAVPVRLMAALLAGLFVTGPVLMGPVTTCNGGVQQEVLQQGTLQQNSFPQKAAALSPVKKTASNTKKVSTGSEPAAPKTRVEGLERTENAHLPFLQCLLSLPEHLRATEAILRSGRLAASTLEELTPELQVRVPRAARAAPLRLTPEHQVRRGLSLPLSSVQGSLGTLRSVVLLL